MSQYIEVDCVVKYARKYLQSTGQLTGYIPRLEGRVEALEGIGQAAIATVRWNCPGWPPIRVLVSNLVRKDRLHLEPV